ncbi:hypothetical protein [Tsukamurella spumae]|uniref:Tox-REase-7 domain-containing protein n=1 Tax=Tsukamurella spumae TaxID=44753 RepID=A0A846XBN0_9ACTN|nr:hypothetical protein [Tsukamurella spumae]NKY21030.1 hypothetical protein [Tsukamurella spumae]
MWLAASDLNPVMHSRSGRAGKTLAQIQRNNAAGLEGANWLARNQYPGAIVDKAKFEIPGLGGRRVDILTQNLTAIEVKTGETAYASVRDQVAKDAILNQGAVQGVRSVEWVFMKSVFTGKGGPDQALINALNAAGIPWKVI